MVICEQLSCNDPNIVYCWVQNTWDGFYLGMTGGPSTDMVTVISCYIPRFPNSIAHKIYGKNSSRSKEKDQSINWTVDFIGNSNIILFLQRDRNKYFISNWSNLGVRDGKSQKCNFVDIILNFRSVWIFILYNLTKLLSFTSNYHSIMGKDRIATNGKRQTGDFFLSGYCS